MRHYFTFVCLIAVFCFSSPASAADRAEITLSDPGAPHHAPLTLRLMREHDAVRCEGAGMPKHRIEVAGLKADLSAPFKPPLKSNSGEECSRISWAAAGQAPVIGCYRRGSNAVLDAVIRACTSM